MDVGVADRNWRPSSRCSAARRRTGCRMEWRTRSASRPGDACDRWTRARINKSPGRRCTVEIPFALRLLSAGAQARGGRQRRVRRRQRAVCRAGHSAAAAGAGRHQRGAVGDSFYVERALAAAEGPAGMRLERVTAEQVSADPAALDGAVTVVLFSTAGLDRRGSDAIGRAVEQGIGLLVVPGPSLDHAPSRTTAGSRGAARLGGRIERGCVDVRADGRASPGLPRVRHGWRSARVGAVPPGGAMARVGGTADPGAVQQGRAGPRGGARPRAVTWSCSRAILRTRGTTSRCDPRSCRSCTTCSATSRPAGR